MELSASDKTEVLLQVLDFNIKEIHRREEEQQKLFEWSTSLLLATFGAIVALSGRATSLAYPIPIKILATALIAVPTSLFIHRIMTRVRGSVGNAKAVERIEETLHLFEDGYYGASSPYPHEWEIQGKLAKDMRKSKTPIYYALILGLMTVCVVTTVWLLL
jgi:hypothetical protein